MQTNLTFSNEIITLDTENQAILNLQADFKINPSSSVIFKVK